MDKINEGIHKLYNKNNLMQKYGGEVFISVLIIFIVGVIFTYLQVLNSLEPVKKNWGVERCNPFIIPLAGFINNTDKKNKSDKEYTIDNFEFCLGNIITSSYSYLLDPFKYILSGITDMFQDILVILEGLISWMMSLITWILEFLENIWNLALQNVASSEKLLNKVRDSFSRTVSIVVVTLYIQMMLFRMSIMWMITTPIFMIFNIVCDILVKILMWCMMNQAITMLKWAQFSFCVTDNIIMNSLSNTANDQFIASAAEASLGAIAAAAGAAANALGLADLATFLLAPAAPAIEAAGVLLDATGGADEAAAGAEAAVATGEEGAAVGTFATTMASCSASISTIIYQAYLMVMIMIQITALILSITIIILLWNFCKSTLGAMNIQGQGIPGLSF